MSATAPLLQPRFLSREEAAEYVGVSPTTFDAEVRAGVWPAAMARGAKGGRLTWDKRLLDARADQIGGLLDITGQTAATVPQGADADAAMDDHWDRCIDAATKKLQPRAGRQKASR